VRNVPATRDEISTLIERRAESSQRWERQIAPGVDRSDLRDELVAETIEKAIQAQRWQGSNRDLDGFLNSLGLLVHREVTNAGLLLYGKNPTRVLPQARVRLLVLPRGKTGSIYSVDRLFEGCLLETAKQIPDALAAYTGGVESRFSEEWARSDRVIYPPDALKEGVMNALVHRDYSLAGSITISILAGSLQISNPGGLPRDLKPADLKRDHLSLPRNPDVAHVCFLQGLIEKVGRGTQRIVEVCRLARIRDPRWQTNRLVTTLAFFSPGIAPAKIEEMNDRQQRIIREVRKAGRIHARDLTRLIARDVSDRTVRTDLEELVRLGLLIRRGRGRSTSYTPGWDLEHG
jgi:ATP-dependent DNA helicase RecG